MQEVFCNVYSAALHHMPNSNEMCGFRFYIFLIIPAFTAFFFVSFRVFRWQLN